MRLIPDPPPMSEQFNEGHIIFHVREGDVTLTLSEQGLAEDTENLICGYLTSLGNPQEPIRVVGLIWDEWRILISASPSLNPRERYWMNDHGFDLDGF